MSEIAADGAGLASGLMTAAHEIGAALGAAGFSAVAVAAASRSPRRCWSRRSGRRPALAWQCTEMASRPLTGYQREVAERNVEAILDAAENLLRSQGPVNISAVAVQAGVSRVTVYAHFPTWQALLEAAVERAAQRTMAALQSVRPDHGPAAGALDRMIAAAWQHLASYQAMAAAVALIHACSDQVRAGQIRPDDAVRILTTSVRDLFTGTQPRSQPRHEEHRPGGCAHGG